MAHGTIPRDIPFTGNPGVQVQTLGFEPYHYFALFINDDLLNCFITESNRYANDFIAEGNLRRRFRANDWFPTNKKEIKEFLGLLFLMVVKSQVLIRAIDYAIRHELSVLVAAPVALLAQGYNSIFYDEVTTDTLHGAFSIPIDGPLPNEINHRMNQDDMIVVDEASMISAPIFGVMASTFNRVNLRPVVVLAGDKCQQQHLQTVNGRITSTTSIINDNTTFMSNNAVIHCLHQQFRIVDAQYAAFLDLIRFIRPTQEQVDRMQQGIVLCPEGDLTDRQIWTAFQTHTNTSVMTVSRKGAQRINSIVVGQLFKGRPLSNIPCASVADSEPIYPYRNMRVIFTENCDKAARVVNGQQATIISSQNNTIILRLPEGQQVFVYLVTHIEDDVPVTRYPFTPAYAQTIIKAQGQNIHHLIIWLDSPLVPADTAYVGLSRVKR